MKKMAEEVIRYGGGGLPYKGNVGPQGTQEAPVPEPEIELEPEVKVEVIEDDTPLTEDEVIEKAKGTAK